MKEFAEFLPEEKRAEFLAKAEKAIFINSREDVKNLRKSNPAFEAEFVTELGTMNDLYAKKFQEEKLPGIVKEELKKLNPTKDPKDLALEELQNKFATLEKQNLLEKRRAEAAAKLAAANVPVDLVEFAVHADEQIFNANLERLTGLKKTWLDAEITKALAGVTSQPHPKGGSNKEVPKMKLDDFNALPAEQRIAFASAGGVFE